MTMAECSVPIRDGIQCLDVISEELPKVYLIIPSEAGILTDIELQVLEVALAATPNHWYAQPEAESGLEVDILALARAINNYERAPPNLGDDPIIDLLWEVILGNDVCVVPTIG